MRIRGLVWTIIGIGAIRCKWGGKEGRKDTGKDKHGGTENTEIHRGKIFRYGKAKTDGC